MADILVTGAFGVMGSQILRLLVKQGVRPVGISRNPDLGFVRDIIEDIDVARGDVSNLVDMLHILKEHQVKRIIHAANLIDAESDPYQGFQVGAVGTVNVLEAARLMDIERVVFTSSKGVYGIITGEHAHPSYVPLTEDYARNPENELVYPAAKIMSETMGCAYHERYGLDFVVLRFGHTWGPGKQLRHGPLSTYSRIVENAMLGQPTRISRGKDQHDDIVYLKDAAQGVVKACYAPNTPSMFYNIASGRLISLGDFADALSKVIPGAVVEVGPGGLDYVGANHPRYSLYDISRARQELGYEPNYGDLETGIRDYVDTMKSLALDPIAS